MDVLVSAASRHGATSGIADAIAARLQEHELQVVRREPDDVGDLAGVGAVVLGSAIYMGRWLEPARDLVERLGDELSGMPVWLFSSGPLGDPPVPEEPPADGAVMVAATGARDHVVFAGRLDRDGLGWSERVVARAVGAPEGDARDWVSIGAWADRIAEELSRLPQT